MLQSPKKWVPKIQSRAPRLAATAVADLLVSYPLSGSRHPGWDPGVVMTLLNCGNREQTLRDQTRSDCPQNITAIGWAKDRFSSNPHLFLVNLGAYCKAFPCSPLDPLTRDWTWRMLHQHEPTYSIYCMQRSKPEGMVIPSLKKS